jgi:hypothetical protein
MKWLGHYDFGKIFKPINFDVWLGGVDAPYDSKVDFWRNAARKDINIF